jgi:hypothetical protein
MTAHTDLDAREALAETTRREARWKGRCPPGRSGAQPSAQ